MGVFAPFGAMRHRIVPGVVARWLDADTRLASMSEGLNETIAYLELPIGANLEYYVASAAEEIHTGPGSATPLVGLAAEYLFLGGLWEKLGAGVEVEGVGEYKSFTETLAGRKMSAPFREMANSLLDSVDRQFVAGIATSSRVPKGSRLPCRIKVVVARSLRCAVRRRSGRPGGWKG